MGTVYLAHDTLLDRAVAIKFLSVPQAQSAQRTRFLTEARALARLHHPNIVAIYRIGEHAGQPYLSSEYVRGQPLSALKKPLPAAQVRELAIGLCRGLHAAHRGGVLHRDIKPANAIRAEDGEVKLLDFGLAKLAADGILAPPPPDEPASGDARPIDGDAIKAALMVGQPLAPFALDATRSLDGAVAPSLDFLSADKPAGLALLQATQAGTRLGTPLYMAPELWRGEPATVRSDLYALGALLYELASGRPPHTGSGLAELEQAILTAAPLPICQLVADFDRSLAALIERCLNKDPSLRPPSVLQLLTELNSLLRPPQPLPATNNPFRGLLPFEAEHRAFFIGRSSEISQVVDLLRTRSLVVVSGSSGVGKSSLCRAGVIPSLTEGALTDARDWQAMRMVPGKRPLLALASGLAPHLALTSEETLLLAEQDPAALVRRLLLQLSGSTAEGGKSRGLVVFIDQLEELVSQSADEDGLRFGALLAEFLTPLPALRVLMSVRGDFLFRVMESTGLHQELAQALYVLPPLSSASLEEVITGPAHICGFTFEDATQSAVMAQSASRAEGGLPLLQFALAELWELRDQGRRIIPAQALDRIGGVAGALARYADGILSRLPPPEHRAANQILTRLVTAAGTRLTRNRDDLVTGSPAVQQAAAVALEVLVGERLLVARQSPTEGAVYEIAHEALLQGWTTLRELLTQDSERRAVTERLELAAAEWERLGRSQQALWQNQQLAEIDVVQLRLSDLPSQAGHFVTASRRAAQRQRLIRYSVPALAVLTLLGADRGVRWYSARPARALVARAEQAMDQAHTLRTQTAALQAQAYARFDAQDIKGGNQIFKQALEKRQATIEQYQRVQTDAASALALRVDLTQAAVLIQQSSREREFIARAFAIGAPADHDKNAPARLTLRIRPEGTTVALQRADGNTARRGWLAAEPLGATPIAEREFAAGSYLLTLNHPGRVPTRYPVYLYAGETFLANFTLPKPEYIPKEMVYIPPGRLLYGSGEEEEIREWLGAQPIHPVSTDGYLIARHETTYSEWIEFLESLSNDQRAIRMPRATGEKGRSVELERLAAGRYRLTLQPAGGDALVAETGHPIRYPQRDRRREQDWYKFPVSGITREDAEAYTQWLHESGRMSMARLCTEYEWERAARGADERKFPIGDNLDQDDANIDTTYGRNPQGFGPDVVGAHSKSNSVFGVADMAGNVREWVQSTDSTGDYVYRDGSFYHSIRTSRSNNRQAGAAAQRNILIGFRYCSKMK